MRSCAHKFFDSFFNIPHFHHRLTHWHVRRIHGINRCVVGICVFHHGRNHSWGGLLALLRMFGEHTHRRRTQRQRDQERRRREKKSHQAIFQCYFNRKKNTHPIFTSIHLCDGQFHELFDDVSVQIFDFVFGCTRLREGWMRFAKTCIEKEETNRQTARARAKKSDSTRKQATKTDKRKVCRGMCYTMNGIEVTNRNERL